MAMIEVSNELFEKVKKSFPRFMEHLKWKTNALAHMYFKTLDFIDKLGLKGEFLETFDADEKYIYNGLEACKGDRK